MSAPAPSRARLVSVNVGMPRDVEWQGRIVHTGIWKTAVGGPRMVTRLNVEGDGQGDPLGHGGLNRAVFVYQLESYRYWQDHLRRDDFVFGQFGENFTVEGMPDDEVCIGDHYRIGEAVFEVSQPRVTCYRLGLRMDEPRMPALVVAHHRPGFYLRTLQEGRVEAGDTIEKLATGPESMSVAEIDGLLYLPHRRRAALARALRIPALSDGWQGSFRGLLAQGDASTSHTPPPAWRGLRALRVAAIEPETASVVSVRLRPDDDQEAAAPAPGQFLTVRVQPTRDGPTLTRSYSLSGPPSAHEYRISVKRDADGAASGYLHTGLRVGDLIQAGAPRGEFVLQPSSRATVLVSAGIGATPVLAMLHAFAAQATTQPVWWLHAARDREQHPFREEVAALLDALPASRRLICYSRPRQSDQQGRDYDVAGRLSAALMDERGVPIDADFYICGPGPFMRDIAAGLTARGAAPERIRSELFGSAEALSPGLVTGGEVPLPHPPAGEPAIGAPVTFARSNLSVPWDPSFSSTLEFAEACDVPVRWACRTGVCHACQTGVISGAVTYDPQPLEPPSPGDVLLCCSTPDGDLILDL